MSFHWEWDVVYHYTSRANRASILQAGVIYEGADGCVYLTPTRFTNSQEAMQALSIPSTFAECGIEIRTSILPPPTETRQVPRLPDLIDLGVIRRGGGTQIIINGNVDLPIAIFVLQETDDATG